MAADFLMGKWQVFPDDCHVTDGNHKVKLEPKAMDLLVVLAQAQSQLVSREDIFSSVWKNQIIADHVLYNLIANLRKILEDDPHKPKYIITAPKKGYRLGQAVRLIEKGRSDQQKKLPWRKWLNVCAGTIVIAAMAYWINKPAQDKPIFVAQAALPSIAVLPFDVYDAEPNSSYFADGLAEEIIHQLTVIPELAVVSRTSSFSFRDKGLDIKTIAKRLNSQFILEGSIRTSENQFRVTIQLIETQTSTHLWSKIFDVTEPDIFKIQQDISMSVVNSLLPDYGQLPSGKIRVHPQHGEAYMHYLRGNAMAAKGTVDYHLKAIQEFEKAIELQPEYALAHVSIALNTMVLFQYRVVESAKARKIAQTAIENALRIDPFLALAHTAQGLLYVNYDDFFHSQRCVHHCFEIRSSTAFSPP